jgi:hypothetical protein
MKNLTAQYFMVTYPFILFVIITKQLSLDCDYLNRHAIK